MLAVNHQDTVCKIARIIQLAKVTFGRMNTVDLLLGHSTGNEQELVRWLGELPLDLHGRVKHVMDTRRTIKQELRDQWFAQRKEAKAMFFAFLQEITGAEVAGTLTLPIGGRGGSETCLISDIEWIHGHAEDDSWSAIVRIQTSPGGSSDSRTLVYADNTLFWEQELGF
jgi:hypothetical protein